MKLHALSQERPVLNDFTFAASWVWNSSTIEPSWQELEAWCVEHYGPESVRWCGFFSSGVIYFVDEKDLMLFLLKWA